MYNTNIPTHQDVPSTGKLIKSTILAAITAGIILVTIVIPAEYGLDPTGFGEKIGLKKMGEIKVSLAKEAAEEQNKAADKQDVAVVKTEPVTESVEAAPDVPVQTEAEKKISTHEIEITIAPNGAAEVKAVMEKGAVLNYSWQTDGGKAVYNMHGDSEKLKINYHNYNKGKATEKSGKMTAAFEGSHGWSWRNRTSETFTVTLKTEGEYSRLYRAR